MEIDIDDIDLDEVPGYTPITKSTPIWKRDMIEKKNQEKIEEYIRKKQKEKEEAEKWKNVPAWKRKLMLEKEKEKESKVSDDTKKSSEQAREAEEQRRQRIREQQEMERQMEEELKDVPAWKREIMMKKGGAIKNWGDERADINDQEGVDQDRLSDGTPEESSHPQKSAPAPKEASPIRRSTDEQKLEEEWDNLPEWKKEIIMKKGGTIRNWGDEREEVNEVEYH